MTTKLIQELAGLCLSDKNARLYVATNLLILDFEAYGRIRIDTLDKDAPAQLQAAIDKVKAL